MRLRSMKIKKEKKCSERLSTSLNSSIGRKHNRDLNLSLQLFTDSENKKAISETIPEATPEIDEVDDEFDPTELNHLERQRPIRSLLPNIPLPHAELLDQYIWTRSVPRCIHPLDSQSLLEGQNSPYLILSSC